MVFGYNNVIYSSTSQFPLEHLCEKEFLSQVFADLSVRMGGHFGKWRFCIHSHCGGTDSDVSLGADDVVLIYISDETMADPGPWAGAFPVAFKNYLRRDRIGNVHALPLGPHQVGLGPQIKSMEARRNDVFFSGNLNGPRFRLYQELSFLRWLPASLGQRLLHRFRQRFSMNCSGAFGRSQIHFTDAFRGGLDGSVYLETLCDSRIALCPMGFASAETFRHYEALRAGCVVISEPLPDVDYYRDSPVVQLEDWRGLRPLVRALLKSPGHLEDLQMKGLEWADRYLSAHAVAERIASGIAGLEIEQQKK